MPGTGDKGLDGVIQALAGLTAAARGGGLDDTAALASLAAARRLADELERSELALIEAARDGGATWSTIAAAMGARNRQTAQKRHADLARRCPRPPSVDTPPPALHAPGSGITDDPGPAIRRGTKSADKVPRDREAASPKAALAAARRSPVPRITAAVIAEGRYELVKAPGHAETRAWHVLVSGRRAGLVRPTWRRERSRPGWEGAGNAGTALPAAGIGRVTAAGNARTRDAAAVSLLRALLRQQESSRAKPATEPCPPLVDAGRPGLVIRPRPRGA
jgi:hypothetical protein